ncbi:hypothetical protein ACFYUK_02105 [Nonomuraea wenchangensis]
MQSKKLLTVPLALIAAGACVATAAVVGTSTASAESRPSGRGSGFQLVTLPNANVPNFQRRTLYCPAGKKVVGGGAEARGNGAILVGSFPTDDRRGWIGIGRQIGYNDVGISVFAICADD